MKRQWKKSRWVHIFRKNGECAFFNAKNLKTLYGDRDSLSVLNSFSKPIAMPKVLSKYKNKQEAEKIVRQFIKAGFLVSRTKDEAKSLKNEIQNLVKEKRKALGKEMRLNAFRMVLTEKCNMRCSYCFVQRDCSLLREMNLKTMLKALDLLVSLNKNKDIEVQFFGGEPLLKFDMIQKAVKYLSQCLEKGAIKSVYYGVTINGTLLNKQIASFFARNNFLVSLSVDGWEEINDLNRKFASGRGSFEKIVKAFYLLKGVGCETGLLLTPNQDNISVLAKICEYFIREFDCKFITINTPQSVDGSWGIKGKIFSNQIKKTFEIAKKYDAVINSFGSRIIFALDTLRPQILACSQFGQNYTATVTPGGKISPCIIAWQLGGYMASINNFSYKGSFRKWKIYKPLALEDCLNCEAISFCGGPCPLELYQAKENQNRIDRERCKFFKDAIRWAVWVQ